jgi:hypothetical protein
MGVLKSLIWITAILILIFLASYVIISDEMSNTNTRVYFIDTNTAPPALMKFEVAQEPSGYDILLQAMRASDARRRNLMYERIDEEIDKCLKRMTKNWKASYSNRRCEEVYEDGEWKEENCFWDNERSYFGIDEEDEAHLRWMLRQRWLNGEKIC